MRILVLDTDEVAQSVGVYLTRDEATQLLGHLEDLLASPEGAAAHVHLSDAENVREVMVVLYHPDGDLDGFDNRSRRVIESDT